MTDRIITLDTPESGHIGLLKNGNRIGLVYWADLDSKQYRRVCTFRDIHLGPWEGGQIVGTLYLAEAEFEGNPTPEDRNLPIGQYPVVEYAHPVKIVMDPNANTRSTPLSVEGTFDEAFLSADASPELRARYPDLRVRERELTPEEIDTWTSKYRKDV